MHRRAVLCLLLLAGCGSGPPSSVVPADASIYLGVDASEAERILPVVSRGDVDFERDVRPWLGDRAAYFAAGDAAGLVLESEDDDAAEAFGRKVTAGGPMRASAVIDGHLVLAADRGLLRAANAAAGGQALADSTRLDVSGEDDDRAPDVLLAAGPDAFAGGMQLIGFDALDLPEPGAGPFTARVWRDDGGERTEIAGLPAEDPPTLVDVPGAAWLAIASGDLSAGDPLARGIGALRTIQRWPELGLEGLFEHLGAGVFFVQGRSRLDVGARLLAVAPDEAALRRAVTALARDIPRSRWSAELNAGAGYLQLAVSRRGARLGPRFFLQVEDGRLFLNLGERVGGVADDLDATAPYRDAERRLRGAPTLLIVDVDGGYLAARREGGALRVVRRAG